MHSPLEDCGVRQKQVDGEYGRCDCECGDEYPCLPVIERARRQEQQQAKQSSGKPDDKSDEKDGEKTYAVGQMTPEQAQQLLDTQKNEEKLLPVKPTRKPVDRSKPLRDW